MRRFQDVFSAETSTDIRNVLQCTVHNNGTGTFLSSMVLRDGIRVAQHNSLMNAAHTLCNRVFMNSSKLLSQTCELSSSNIRSAV